MKRRLMLLLAGLLAGSFTGSLNPATTPTQEAKAPGPDEWVAPSRAARKKNPVSADEASLDKGKRIYTRECHSCHGPAGKGDGPEVSALEKHPGDLSDPKLWEQTDGALFWKLTEGRSPMPTVEKLLTEEERWHVINYIRHFAPQPSK